MPAQAWWEQGIRESILAELEELSVPALKYLILITSFLVNPVRNFSSNGVNMSGCSNSNMKITAADINSEMVLVPAGSFLMGSTDEDIEKEIEEASKPRGPALAGQRGKRRRVAKIEWYKKEIPQRKVWLNAFWMDKFETTNKQYREFIRGGGYNKREYWSREGWQWRSDNNISQPRYWGSKKYGKEDFPVVGVSWYEADAYAGWCGKRLPTEAEWERAARGTDGLKYPWGDQWNGKRCNWADNGNEDGYRALSWVGAFKDGVSPVGYYDMAGNVCEWCSDWFDLYCSTTNEITQAERKPRVSSLKISRGGAFVSDETHCRTTGRFVDSPGTRNIFTGFRLVLDH